MPRWARIALGIGTALATVVFGPAASAAPGDLDPEFSGDGRVRIDLGDEESVGAVKADSAGRPIVLASTGHTDCQAGYLCWPAYRAALIRPRDDGSLDSAFGRAGSIVLEPPRFEYQAPLAVLGDDRMALIPDESDVAAVAADGVVTWRRRFDGARRDAGYHTPETILAMPDGGFAIGGYLFTGSSTAWIDRRTPAGLPDPGFGVDGTAYFAIGRVSRLLTRPAGELIAIGPRLGPDAAGPAVVQLEPDGAIDTSFAGDGFGSYGSADGGSQYTPVDAGIESDGDLILASRSTGEAAAAVVQRVRPNGTLDAAYGEAGTASIGRRRGSELDLSAGLVLSDDRTLLVFDEDAGRSELHLLDAQGRHDPGFGGGDGRVVTPRLHALAAAELPGGRVLVGGHDADAEDLELASYSLVPGPADADADGIGDGSDRCVEAYSQRPSGCPRVRRRVTLRYARKRLIARVRIADEHAVDCLTAGSVRFERIRRGRTRRIGRSRIRRQNGIALMRVRSRRGRYRATVLRADHRTSGRCGRARSKPIRVRAGSRRAASATASPSVLRR